MSLRSEPLSPLRAHLRTKSWAHCGLRLATSFSRHPDHTRLPTRRHVTYAGLSLAVPTSWPIDNNTLWDECRGVDEPFAPSDQVVFDRGTVNIAGISCSSSNTYPVVEMPSDGVAIVEGPYSAAEENGGTFGGAPP